ncbi:MAG: domain containing protein [Verrucomicrobiales bacterium]|nr:domain containing protein [Verrucomicrobiales bacterium]
MDSELFFDLRLGINKVGRVLGNTFQVEHPTISSQHCVILWLDDGVILVRDCGSTNGTFINDESIKESRLTSGQILKLGDVEFELDSAQANVSVPNMRVPMRPAALADGSIPCFTTSHWTLPAIARCVKCKKEYCSKCIHVLTRSDGQLLQLCPNCSGEMQPLPGKGGLKLQKKSFFGRIKETLKLTRKH